MKDGRGNKCERMILATNIAGSAIADELFLSAGKRGSKIPLKPANILYKYIHTDEIHVDVNSATTPWRMHRSVARIIEC